MKRFSQTAMLVSVLSYLAVSGEAADAPASGRLMMISDVALAESGLLRGRLIDSEGRPIDGAHLVLRQSDRVVATMVTESQGQFAVTGLRPGVCRIEAPRATGTFRLWRPAEAPPSAMSVALLVTQQPIVRGQMGYGSPDLLTLGLGAAGVTLGVIALSDTKSAAQRAERPRPVSP